MINFQGANYAGAHRNMSKPGIEIRKFFGPVRDDVMASTGNSQEPFVYGSLGGDDYFLRKP
jgi:hypothetical protein